MFCYRCGCTLSEHDFCTSCGADVALYKKIIYISNRFYNEGLARASVRDLTGAIVSLRQSLKFNKHNIEARNLLGLVYFEMGEVVAALSEWVISKNLRPKKNIADDYINMIQMNQTRLETINQTIKKYNQAVAYCHQESYDLAVIQLKKVISLNPKFVRARQLIALLYLNSNQNDDWEKARTELKKCIEIDVNNTDTLRYLKECENMLFLEEDLKKPSKKQKKNEVIVRYQSGTETIIQPVNVKDGKGVTSLLNLLIGIAIGVAVCFFMILPARIQQAKETIDIELKKVSEQSDAKTATIDELTQQIEELTQGKETLEKNLQGYLGTDGVLQSVELLLSAANTYLSNPEDVTAVAEYLEEIEKDSATEERSEAFNELYQTLMQLVGSSIAEAYYNDGYEAYRQENYEDAVPNLEKAYKYDPTNGEALYHLANSYNKLGRLDEARTAYEKIIELFPDTEKANKAQNFLAEMEIQD